jgi:hypothetical protein
MGLPGLAGIKLPITDSAHAIAFFAAGLVILRFAFEDFSLRIFHQRLSKLEPAYRERTITQQLIATAIKVAIFGVMAAQFIGVSIQLFIGIVLFALPLLMGIFEDKFPKAPWVKKWMPTGIIEMLVMTVGGYFLAMAVSDQYPDARSYVLASFIILSIPGLLLSILTLFGADSVEDWRVTRSGRLIYRTVGVIALSALIYIILSGLLISNHV